MPPRRTKTTGGGTGATQSSQVIPSNSIPPISNTGGSAGVSSNAGPLMLRPREFNLTMPPPDDYYLVRDEELSSLSEAGKKIPLEISLASAGAALGLLQNVGLVIADIFNANVPSIWNLIASTLCIGLMVLAVTKGFEYRSARADIDATMKKIRDSGGRKVPVQHGEQTQQQI